MTRGTVERLTGWSRAELWAMALGASLSLVTAIVIVLATVPTVRFVNTWPARSAVDEIVGFAVIGTPFVIGSTIAIRLLEGRWIWARRTPSSMTGPARVAVAITWLGAAIGWSSAMALGAGDASATYAGYVVWVGNLQGVVVGSLAPTALAAVGLVAGGAIGQLVALVIVLLWDSRAGRLVARTAHVVAEHWPSAP
jgi:hypothetical protein